MTPNPLPDIQDELRQLQEQVKQLEKGLDVQSSLIGSLKRQVDSMKRPLPSKRILKDGRKPMIHDLLNRLQAYSDDGITAADMIKLVDDMGYKPASVRASLNNARKVGQVIFNDGRYYPLEVKQFEFRGEQTMDTG